MRLRRAVHLGAFLAGLAACANHKSEAKPVAPPPPPAVEPTPAQPPARTDAPGAPLPDPADTTGPAKGHCDSQRETATRGNPHAPVTACEFSDFQCPHCKLMGPILARLLDDFGGQVRLVYKNYPISKLHPEAREAAAAAAAAGAQ